MARKQIAGAKDQPLTRSWGAMFERQLDKKFEKLLKILLQEIADTRYELKGDIAALDQKLSARIDSVDKKLSGRIDSLDSKIGNLIHKVDRHYLSLTKADHDLDVRVVVLETKVA